MVSKTKSVDQAGKKYSVKSNKSTSQQFVRLMTLKSINRCNKFHQFLKKNKKKSPFHVLVRAKHRKKLLYSEFKTTKMPIEATYLLLPKYKLSISTIHKRMYKLMAKISPQASKAKVCSSSTTNKGVWFIRHKHIESLYLPKISRPMFSLLKSLRNWKLKKDTKDQRIKSRIFLESLNLWRVHRQPKRWLFTERNKNLNKSLITWEWRNKKYLKVLLSKISLKNLSKSNSQLRKEVNRNNHLKMSKLMVKVRRYKVSWNLLESQISLT